MCFVVARFNVLRSKYRKITCALYYKLTLSLSHVVGETQREINTATVRSFVRPNIFISRDIFFPVEVFTSQSLLRVRRISSPLLLFPGKELEEAIRGQI